MSGNLKEISQVNVTRINLMNFVAVQTGNPLKYISMRSDTY